MIVKLLTEHHWEFLSLKGVCRGSSESTHVKMPHSALAHIYIDYLGIKYNVFSSLSESMHLLLFLLLFVLFH